MTSSGNRHWPSTILLALALIQLLATFISLVQTNRGLVRILDFVREPSIYLSALFVIIAVLLAKQHRWLIVGLAVLSAAINLYRIWPYSMLAESELPLPDDVDGMSCMRVLSFNVLQPNDKYDAVAAMIDREDPDVLLLMETNQAWVDALRPQLARYPFQLIEPLENTYGMTFATRMRVERANMVANTSSNTPTLYATLNTGDGARFELIGLHPRPPLPGESTETRDANIARAGSKTPEELDNVLAIGDFNDVPWSRTTQNFVAEGGYLDPRVGRGSFATFPARFALLGWPLDQLFVKNGVKVESFRLLDDDTGSDHLALRADVCAGPEFDTAPTTTPDAAPIMDRE